MSVKIEILARVADGDLISIGTGQIDGPTPLQINRDVRDLFHQVAQAVEREVLNELDGDQRLRGDVHGSDEDPMPRLLEADVAAKDVPGTGA